MNTDVEVRCTDCAYAATFDSLRTARTALDDHERETSHSAEWDINRLSGGVERAGADAGVCGREGCVNPDSPLLDHDGTDDA